jgi:glycosyltransferase involved in cell wall biosynthesis
MNRVLAVSWEMPPMYGPRASQVAATLAELAARGWQPSVVCLDPRRGGPHWPDGAAVEPPPGVELIRVPSPEESLAWRVASRLVPIVRRFPDEKRVWVRRAAAVARETIARHTFSGMITFAQPWSDHLIGLSVRRRQRLPWVAHFSDPWVDSPYLRGPAWLQRIWRRMERSVVAEADAVVFVTEETANLVMRKYPDAWRRKVAIVPHGFDPRPAADGAGADRRPGPLRIVYTGRFYRGLRTPLALFRAVAELNRDEPLEATLEILCMGPHVQEFRRDVNALGLDGIVRLEGRRPKNEADRAAADADVLLVVEAPTQGPSVFLPSKLVDYLAFAKPVLGLTPTDGASARLLDRLGCPHVAPDDVRAIRSAVASLLEQWRTGTLRVSAAFHAVAGEFSIRRTTAQLDNVLGRAFTSAS